MKNLKLSIRTLLLAIGVIAMSASSASALYEIEGGGGGGGGGSSTPPPTYTNKIVYMHGRSMGYWPNAGKLVAPSNWNHVISYYNGNARVSDSTVRSTVKNALKTNCRAPNQCVVICFSAGCLRLLKGLDELAAAGTPADRIIWMEATASAAGGSKLANTFTRGLAKLIAKALGRYESVDNDLTTGATRTTYGYVQNRAPVAMYHLAGRGNICKKILLFFKFCTNKYLQGGKGDGAVAPHSACGFSAVGTKEGCASTGSKYTNRYVSGNHYYGHNHFGMVGQGVKNASVRLGYTAAYNTNNTLWSDPGTAYREADCLMDDCDGQETAGGSTSCVHYASLSLGQALASGDTAMAQTGLSCVSGICIFLSGTPPPACSTYTGGGGGGGGGENVMMK